MAKKQSQEPRKGLSSSQRLRRQEQLQSDGHGFGSVPVPVRQTNASDSAKDTLGNIDDALAQQDRLNQSAADNDRLAQLESDADAANQAGANDLSPEQANDIAKDSKAAAASHRAKADQDRDALRQDMSDAGQDAKEALASAKKNTGIDTRRPLTNDDKRKYSTGEERAAGKDTQGLNRASLNIGGRLRQHISGNKKAYGIGGGAFGVIGLLLAAYLALLPTKLEAMMKGIVADHFEGAVDHIVERRAEKIFFKYVVDASEASGRPIVATGNPLTDLYKTWRTGKFEDQLAKKYGVTITRAGNKVRVSGPRGYDPGEFASPGEMEKYFGDLSHRQFRGFLREATKGVTRRDQLILRHHLRLWMRLAYGFRLGKVFSKEGDKDKAKTNLDDVRTKTVVGEYKTRLGKSLACLLGSTSECPDKTPTNNNSTANGDGQEAGQSTEETIADRVAKTTGKDFAKDVAADLLKLVVKKVVPVIGWVDMAAHLDDFIWNNRADAIIAYIRSPDMANEFGTWKVIVDQWQDGDNVSGAEVNAAMTASEGVEKSCEYQRINRGSPEQGCEAVGRDQKVSFGIGKTVLDVYKANPFASETHAAYQLYLGTVGKILGWVGDIFSAILHLIPGVTSFENWIATKFIDLISFLLAPACTGHELGSQLYNCLSGGADVVANDFADNMGAPEVPDSQAYARDEQVAVENDGYQSSKGLWYRLTSLDYRHSVASQLVAMVPTDPIGTAVQNFNSMLSSNNLMRYTANLFMSPFNFQPAMAAAEADPFGVKQHRYSSAELDAPIDEAALTAAAQKAAAAGRGMADISPDDCPDPEKRPNTCRADIIVIQAMRSVFTTDDDGGMSGDGAAAPATGPAPAAGAWIWPIDKSQYQGISQCWNVVSARGHHAGMDLVASSGTPVHAANNGTIVETGNDSAAGNYMIVKVQDGLYYVMEHLQTFVKRSGPVNVNDVIAYSDNTGSSTGPHLHFGVAVAQTLGSYANNSQTRDPLDYLPNDRSEAPCR